jgi:PTH1 family peptidyl-tRNA hydrolase
MKFCFVGLGNPGKEYSNTRHNAGFIAIDKLSFYLKINNFNNFEGKLLYAETVFKDNSIYLAKPYNYMNNSGIPLKSFCKYKNIDVIDVILIYDDIDTEIGKLRIRKTGSSGGHKGVESIIKAFGSNDIKRIRIGIGPKPDQKILSEYVLSPFTKSEISSLNTVIEKIPEIFESIIERGFDYAMSRYNSNI